MANKRIYSFLFWVVFVIFIMTILLFVSRGTEPHKGLTYIESNHSSYSLYINKESKAISEENHIVFNGKIELSVSGAQVLRLDINNSQKDAVVRISNLTLSLGSHNEIVFNGEDIARYFIPNNHISHLTVNDSDCLITIKNPKDPFLRLNEQGLERIAHAGQSRKLASFVLPGIKYILFIEIILLGFLAIFQVKGKKRVGKLIYIAISFKGNGVASKRELLAAFILLLLTLVAVFNTNPFAGETLAPTDLLLSSDKTGYLHLIEQGKLDDAQATYAIRSDIIDAFLPNKIFGVDRILGRLENPSFYKMPLWKFADSWISPGFFVFLIFKGSPFGFYLTSLLNYLICGMGLYLLARRYMPFLPAFSASLIFLFSGQMAGWFYWHHVYTIIWAPWIFWRVLVYTEREDKKQGWLIPLFTALMVGGGFPSLAAFTLYAVLLMLGYFLILNIKEIKSYYPKVVMPGVLVLLGCGLMSFTVFPYMDYLEAFNIIETRTGNTPLTPNLLSLLWNFNVSGKLTYPGYVTYIGKAALCLSALSFLSLFTSLINKKQKRVIGFFVLLAVFCLLITFGFINQKFMILFPIFKSNPYQRLNFIALMALSLLSGFGFYVLNLLLVRFVLLVPTLTKTKINHPKDVYHILRFCVFSIIIILFAIQFNPQVELFRKMNYPNSNDLWYPRTDTIQYLVENETPLQYYFFDSSYYHIQGANRAHGLMTWYDHTFKSPAQNSYIRRIVPGMRGTKTASVYNYKEIDFDNPNLYSFLTQLNIGYVVLNSKAVAFESKPDFNDYWVRMSLEPNINIYAQRNNASGAYFADNIKDDIPMDQLVHNRSLVITEVEENKKRIISTYTGKDSGYLVLPLPTYFNLTARVDGTPREIEFFQGFLPAVPVDKGETVTFSFETENAWLYNLFSLFSLIMILILCRYHDIGETMKRINRKKNKEN